MSIVLGSSQATHRQDALAPMVASPWFASSAPPSKPNAHKVGYDLLTVMGNGHSSERGCFPGVLAKGASQGQCTALWSSPGRKQVPMEKDSVPFRGPLLVPGDEYCDLAYQPHHTHGFGLIPGGSGRQSFSRALRQRIRGGAWKGSF